MKYQSRHELVVYTLVWLFLFASPVVSLWAHNLNTAEGTLPFDWESVFRSWRILAVFAVAFAIHNFVFAPMQIYRRKQWLYLACVVLLVGSFMSYQCTRDSSTPHEMELETPPPPPAHDHHPRPPVESHDMVAFSLLLMMLGANLGAKLYYKTDQDRLRLIELERLNLQQELQYLRYQINPHFLMNTLNNIHALVDIDSDKAKTCVIELSRLLRYLLYEGNKHTIPLQHEVEFIKHYLDLMRIRFSDHVRITDDIAESLPTVDVPPLLTIPFIENAFKHGVSYEHPSFIDVTISSNDDTLKFTCRNSKQHEREEHGGVGLANVIKRLDLIYGDSYTLALDDGDEQYSVTLTIPIIKDLKL